MGRAPCCDKANVKKGPWSPEEDAKLRDFIGKYGTGGNWIALPQKAGLRRCGKSCRLRWLNYLRPNIKHGEFSDEEDKVICTLFANIGSRWSIIAAQLPGRTDNDIKNYWNTKLKKKIMGLIPSNQPYMIPPFPPPSSFPQFQSLPNISQFYTPNFTQKPPTSTLSFPQSFAQYSTNLVSSQDQTLSADFPCYYPSKDSMLMFGRTHEASCSSSDGSCSQIGGGRGKEQAVIKQEAGFFSNGGSFDQKLMMLNHYGKIISGEASPGDLPSVKDVEDGCLSEYEMEQEMKKMIMGSNDYNNLALVDDENKKAGMNYYYYY